MIAGFQPEGNLRQNAMTAIEDLSNSNFPLENYAGKTLYMGVTGDNPDGYAYMVTFPVDVNRKDAHI